VIFLVSGANATTYFTGTLSSAQEVPTNASTAVGFGRVTLNDAETQITVSLTFSGLSSNQTASHIHGAAPPGANAPVLFNIGSQGATSGTFTALGFAVTPAQVADLKAGLFYFNVHSTNLPGGEIRGQIGLDSPFVSTFSSNQEVPPSGTAATGSGNVSLNATGTQIIASLQFSGLSSNQTASHIHGAASPGANAPVLFNIGSQGMTSGSFVDLFFSVTPAQVAQLKTGQFYFNVHSVNFPGGEIRGQIQRRRSTVLDFDGDSKTDYIIARNNAGTNSIDWFILNSGGGYISFPLGLSSDFVSGRLMGGDFDGDGKDDVTIWRSAPADQAAFYILLSSNNTVRTELFGQAGDDPRMIADYDGDGRTDPAVWRSGAQAFLYWRPSANNAAQNITGFQWGTSGDFASPGDYDGDGKGDICVQRSTNVYCLDSTAGFKAYSYGLGSDFFAPGDYDGDGKTDLMAVRTISGVRNWFPLRSSDNRVEYIQWGSATGTTRVQGDYDGDGITDIAVWQSGSQGLYFIRASSLLNTGNPLQVAYWGTTGDIPVNGYNVR
ncbi:MAG: CHRD domain-containing protein, partial [Pyrinomonadaceae bacterium]